MQLTTLYNEIDRYCCDWLSNLMDAGLITAGEIDDRRIEELEPDDVRGYDVVHFFAGIGGWDYALQLAKYEGPRLIWTGSCPCQAFSSAPRGRQSRRKDISKHLWPHWKRLIAELMPATIFGEQVTTAGDWFDEVCHDLEALGYAIGASVLPACSVGLDHARSRLFFVGHTNGQSESIRYVDDQMARLSKYRDFAKDLVPTDGISARVAQLCAIGNAIVPQVAAEFIKAAMTGDNAKCG